jgi:hypothetical protein
MVLCFPDFMEKSSLGSEINIGDILNVIQSLGLSFVP